MKTLIYRLFLLCTLFTTAFAVQAQQNPQAAQNASGPFVVVTHVDLLPDTTTPNVEDGIQLLKTYVENTRQAHGNRSALLITWAPTNNHFQVIETWNSQADFEAHIGTPAVIEFRNGLQPLIGSPYEQRLYNFTNTRQHGGSPTISPFN